MRRTPATQAAPASTQSHTLTPAHARCTLADEPDQVPLARPHGEGTGRLRPTQFTQLGKATRLRRSSSFPPRLTPPCAHSLAQGSSTVSPTGGPTESPSVNPTVRELDACARTPRLVSPAPHATVRFFSPTGFSDREPYGLPHREPLNDFHGERDACVSGSSPGHLEPHAHAHPLSFHLHRQARPSSPWSAPR